MRIELFELDLTEEQKKYHRPRFKDYFFLKGKKIKMPEEIWRAFEIKEVCLVHFISDSLINAKRKGYDGSRNIWAFDKDGQKLWEIEHPVESVSRQLISQGKRKYEDDFDKDGNFRRIGIDLNGEERERYDTYNALGQGAKGTEYEGRVGVGTFNGFSGELDIQTGKVFNWVQGK